MDQLDSAIEKLVGFLDKAAGCDDSYYSYQSITGGDGKKQSVKVLDTKAVCDMVSSIEKLKALTGRADDDGCTQIMIDSRAEEWCK